MISQTINRRPHRKNRKDEVKDIEMLAQPADASKFMKRYTKSRSFTMEIKQKLNAFIFFIKSLGRTEIKNRETNGK